MLEDNVHFVSPVCSTLIHEFITCQYVIHQNCIFGPSNLYCLGFLDISLSIIACTCLLVQLSCEYSLSMMQSSIIIAWKGHSTHVQGGLPPQNLCFVTASAHAFPTYCADLLLCQHVCDNLTLTYIWCMTWVLLWYHCNWSQGMFVTFPHYNIRVSMRYTMITNTEFFWLWVYSNIQQICMPFFICLKEYNHAIWKIRMISRYVHVVTKTYSSLMWKICLPWKQTVHPLKMIYKYKNRILTIFIAHWRVHMTRHETQHRWSCRH